LIRTILNYTVSKLVHFLRHSVDRKVHYVVKKLLGYTSP